MKQERIAVLGAAGQVGKRVVMSLQEQGTAVRAVGRSVNVYDGPGLESRSLIGYQPDDIAAAIDGCSSVIATLGVPYKTSAWRLHWTPLVESTAEACALTGLPLTFLDNLYAYGQPVGTMNETHEMRPCSRKGIIRQQGWNILSSRQASGEDIVVCLATDFIGHGVEKSILPWRNVQLCANGSNSLFWLGRSDRLHSFSSGSDIAYALTRVACDATQRLIPVVHMPVLATLTGKEFATTLSAVVGHNISLYGLSKAMISIASTVNQAAREQFEMMYAVTHDFVVDDNLFRKNNPDFESISLDTFLRNELLTA